MLIFRERRAARKAATQAEEETTSSPVISPSPSRDNTPPTSPSPIKTEIKQENNNNLPRRKYGALEPNRGKVKDIALLIYQTFTYEISL